MFDHVVAGRYARGRGLDVFTYHGGFALQLARACERFDTIVLDPPAFASSKHTVNKALRAYKEINLRALRMLAPGGILVTCSCSGRVRPDDFEATVAVAARDAGRRLAILERRGAGSDHPVRPGMPESEYLKCLVCTAGS